MKIKEDKTWMFVETETIKNRTKAVILITERDGTYNESARLIMNWDSLAKHLQVFRGETEETASGGLSSKHMRWRVNPFGEYRIGTDKEHFIYLDGSQALALSLVFEKLIAQIALDE